MAATIRTAVVGSYPQPDWLVDRARLKSLMVPRVRAREIWRVPDSLLAAAQDDATIVAIMEQERAGIDIIGDGEIRRESYSNRFANALSGIDLDRPGEIAGRSGRPIPAPRIVGAIERLSPVEVRDAGFLRAHTEHSIKITLPGPFTMAQQAVNEYYPDTASLAMAYADAVNAEVHELFAAGADIVQLDEPWLQARADAARDYGIEAIDRALAHAPGRTAVHLCFGYAALVSDKPRGGYDFLAELDASATDIVSIEAAQPQLDLDVLEQLESKTIMLGVLDLAEPAVEDAALVAERIRAALDVVPPDRLIATPDCGMKYLPRDVAYGKLRALADGAAIAR